LPDFSCEGDVKVFLSSGYHTAVAAKDTALGLESGEGGPLKNSSVVIKSYEDTIRSIPKHSNIAVLSEHPETELFFNLLQETAQKNNQIIIAPVGHHDRADGYFNSVAVACPGIEFILIDKISFSFDDIALASEKKKNLLPGKRLLFIKTSSWKLAVLNCHDYTHADIVAAILREDVDILVVTTRNQASRLYDEYATADIHRLSCFVIVNNVSDYGGSGVYAPFSRIGEQDSAVTLGGTLFATRGPCEASAIVSLPIQELQELRKFFSRKTLGKNGKMRYQHIDPPEHIKFHPDNAPYQSVITNADNIENINLNEIGYRREKTGLVRIAVAQLSSMSFDDYIDNSYQITRSPRCPSFSATIRNHLELLESSLERQANEDLRPDFLVFPEVFLPLGLEEDVKAFSRRWNTIIIAGVEYDPQPVAQNYGTGKATGINRCRIYIPTPSGVTTRQYIKLTRLCLHFSVTKQVR
jgi:predicted amidohydrolase